MIRVEGMDEWKSEEGLIDCSESSSDKDCSFD